jgi:C4-dicarboxylate transporter DctM subunit
VAGRLQAVAGPWPRAALPLVCGLLALASWRFVASEIQAHQVLAYGVPVWWVQACHADSGFALLGAKLGARCASGPWARRSRAWRCPQPAGRWRHSSTAHPLPLVPAVVALLLALLAGAPVFAVLGGLALALFWSDALPLASVALSHYQITVNPSLPALPLFTLAGLVFARTGAASRLGDLFLALFGGGVHGTVLATAVLCSAFTAITGGSGVTILALGGLLLPLLRHAGYAEQRGIGLVTSASALGVLVAPSVPLIMYAVIARVPIIDMFVAGLVPAVVMVASLLLVGGYLPARTGCGRHAAVVSPHPIWGRPPARLGRPSGNWQRPGGHRFHRRGRGHTHRERCPHRRLCRGHAGRGPPRAGPRRLARCLADCAMLIGGVMLILGMALALTNFLVDAGIPDRAVDWVQGALPNKYAVPAGAVHLPVRRCGLDGNLCRASSCWCRCCCR